nr:head fiber protein [uncultured Niameybacter sp.]
MSSIKNYTEQGGDKTIIGGELQITSEGKLLLNEVQVNPCAFQADSTAIDVEGLVADFNALLTKLKTAGLMKTQ